MCWGCRARSDVRRGAIEVFSPTEQELQWARQVVAAYEQATAAGTGAISVGERMIDMASVRMAQMILQAGDGK